MCTGVGESFWHRLGALGYVALPQLKQDDGCVGNYGLMDTLLGLKWVRENITAFGGDPEQITLAGESGGTAKCCALAAIPQAHGMFKRVISQSGLQWKLHIIFFYSGKWKQNKVLKDT